MKKPAPMAGLGIILKYAPLVYLPRTDVVHGEVKQRRTFAAARLADQVDMSLALLARKCDSLAGRGLCNDGGVSCSIKPNCLARLSPSCPKNQSRLRAHSLPNRPSLRFKTRSRTGTP